MIKIYASELAACVGFNRFKSIDEAATSVFSRTDDSAFQKALYRNRVKQMERIEITLENLQLTERVQKVVQSEKADFVQDLDAIILEMAEKIDPDSIKDLTSYVFTERGKNAEESSINMFEKEMKKIVKNRNNKFHKMYLEYEDVLHDTHDSNNIDKFSDETFENEKDNGSKKKTKKRYLLGGKVDGITDDNELVEVKNRQYKLFDKIPIYEKIQMHAYMFLTGILKCHYVQCYRDKSTTELVEFDEGFWNDVIERLNKFVIKMDRLLKDEAEQDILIMHKTFIID